MDPEDLKEMEVEPLGDPGGEASVNRLPLRK
jgi:hypothetical protein